MLYARIQNWIKKSEKFLFIFLGSSLLSLFIWSFDFTSLEANLYDLRMAHWFQTPVDNRIVLVTLDDKTTKELDEFAPLPLNYHAKFLETLEEMKPKAIGYLVDLNHVTQIRPQELHEVWGKRFLKSAQRLISNGSTFLLGTSYDVKGETLPPFPLSQLPHSISVIHKNGTVFAADKVTRRALLTINNKPAFHYSLAQRMNLISAEEKPRGSYEVPEIKGSYFFFRYHRSPQFNPEPCLGENYPRYSFVDILKRRVPKNILENKIVIIGTLSYDDSLDFSLTPYSKSYFKNPKIIVHANVLDSILHSEGIRRVPQVFNAILLFVVTSFVVIWTMTYTPLYGMMCTLGLAAVFILTNHFLFQVYGFWVRECQPLMGIISGYYLSVPYRLIREYKTRWNYQRRSELLTQVEQLKTNFLSLVTHDLKSPVARIQGLTEMLLRRSKASPTKPLNEIPSDSTEDRLKYQEKLNHILSAADELNHFISSILELTKIESDPLALRFESKDINILVEKAVEEFQDQARGKEISIELDLEPLFPIQLDPSLISKVLNNVIDNAIKYSHAGSTISIQSREEKEYVYISIKDQGIGITKEEQKQLFTRFYRAKNDTTTTIPGTGLGLYLTKYFIEIHQGRVEVSSEKDKGSNFRIYLPIRQELKERFSNTEKNYTPFREQEYV